jgi:hypothetical protein
VKVEEKDSIPSPQRLGLMHWFRWIIPWSPAAEVTECILADPGPYSCIQRMQPREKQDTIIISKEENNGSARARKDFKIGDRD